MFDQIPSRTVPIQSWAMVLAALITNLGVVIAACIQSGWIGKPSSVRSLLRPSSPVNSRASEIGAIDPPIEHRVRHFATSGSEYSGLPYWRNAGFGSSSRRRPATNSVADRTPRQDCLKTSFDAGGCRRNTFGTAAVMSVRVRFVAGGGNGFQRLEIPA